MKKQQAEMVALAVILAGALLYSYYNFIFLPKWAVLQKQQAELKTRSVLYSQLLAHQSNKAGLDKNVESVGAEFKELSVKIPPRLDKPQIMVDIYTIAKLRGVSPQSLSFDALQDKGSYQFMGLNLTATGKIEDILGLIDDFEHTPLQKLAVQSINLSVQTGSQSGSQVQGTGLPGSKSISATQTQPSQPSQTSQSAPVSQPSQASQPSRSVIMDATPGSPIVPDSTSSVTGQTGNQNSQPPVTGNQGGQAPSTGNPAGQTQTSQTPGLSVQPVAGVNNPPASGTGPVSGPGLVTAQIKLTVYASALGTANVNGPNPPYMAAQFGVDSAAQLFKP